ncbi:hypothetical protein [uncultured Flavonifractor sp.]|uniref:hypothetical protein n=1 Tax=uncultured Flavonifractor sp. TaxID=1193534 RepID=UPI00259AC9B6|nr:hypothetical protein [uncultured Flavonifractor sp.]
MERTNMAPLPLTDREAEAKQEMRAHAVPLSRRASAQEQGRKRRGIRVERFPLTPAEQEAEREVEFRAFGYQLPL